MRWHADIVPVLDSSSSGSFVRHRSKVYLHRGLNLHPAGQIPVGGLPGMELRSSRFPNTRGTELTSASV